MGKLWIIARSTFSEIVRQPFFFVILAVAALLTTASPSFCAFTLMNSDKLLRDMGLATILLAAWFLSAVAASQVVSNEIRTRTVLTLLSKPIARWQFVFGKFLGLTGAVALACGILGAVLTIVARFGVPEAAYTVLDWPIMIALLSAYGVAVLAGAGANYWFDRPFTSTAVFSLAFFLIVILAAFGFVDREFQPLPLASYLSYYDAQLALAIVIGAFGALVLASIALALSTRLTLTATAVASLAIYGVGLIADHLRWSFERAANWAVALLPAAAQEGWAGQAFGRLARGAYYLIPNFQYFRAGDVLMEDFYTIPANYVGQAAAYAALLTLVFLLLATALFQEREVS